MDYSLLTMPSERAFRGEALSEVEGAMELCLEVACKLAVVVRRHGRSSDIQPSTEKVIGPLRLDAFASPGSLLGLQSVFVCCWIMTGKG
jgi:hypothetical protein